MIYLYNKLTREDQFFLLMEIIPLADKEQIVRQEEEIFHMSILQLLKIKLEMFII